MKAMPMSSEHPTISIIIPCFNDGHYLLEAIQSVATIQNGKNEIIVVNDGSSEQSTIDTLADLENLGHRVIHQENAGPGRARNHGISLARGRYILPLDADNRLLPEGVDSAVQMLEQDSTIDVAYGDVEFFDGKTGRERHYTSYDHETNDLYYHLISFETRL